MVPGFSTDIAAATLPNARKSALWPWCVIAGAISLAVNALLNSVALNMTADGWVYWQGAVSLAEGHGYKYFSGEPIVTWPPLYSIYLAAWSMAFGPTSLGVAYADALLLCVQAVLWSAVLFDIWQFTETRPSRVSQAMVAVFLGLYLPLNQHFVRAELLFNVFLAPALYFAWKGLAARDRILHSAVWCGVFCSLMIATHHRAAIFIAPAAALVAARAVVNRSSRASALVGAALVVILPAFTWLTIRAAFHQWDSHHTGLAVARDTPLNYVRQMVHSLGDLISSSSPITPRWAVLVLFASLTGVMSRRIGSRPLATSAAFVVMAAGLTLLAFNVTWLDDDLDPRFVLFIPLIAVPFLLFAADQIDTRLGVLVGGVILTPLLTSTLGTVATARSLAADPREIVVHNSEISSRYLSGPPVPTSRGRLVVPELWHEADDYVKMRRRQPQP